MEKPLVSVKMITYNHAPFIAQAIEGVVGQRTAFPFELVIGEDCSTDGTREIVFEYQKRYPGIIRVITSDRNVGMRKNGLRTLQACRGTYVAFCEGDDHWHHPRKMQKQAEYLEAHPECGLVYSSYDVHDVGCRKTISDYLAYKKRVIPPNPTLMDIIEDRGGLLTCTVMLRRNLYEQVIASDPYLYQSDEFLMGDTQLWAEIATISRLHYIPESLATHNITDESATRSRDRRKVARFGVSSAKLLLYLCDKYHLPAPVRTRNQDYLLRCKLLLAYHTRDRQLADEVREEKKTFTMKEWLRYQGARNAVFHYAYRLSAWCMHSLRKRHAEWS